MLIGHDGQDYLEGNGGSDRLEGGEGADTMVGGAGKDTYVVDDPGDEVIEAINNGTDTIESAIAFDLGTVANVENLILTGTDNLTGIGNAASNVLTGNAGNNTLDGKGGADQLIGGLGDDTYLVDDANDRIVETSAGGYDTVKSTVSYALDDNVEELILLGEDAINGTGNASSNTVIGNSATNILDGGEGTDTLVGGAGDDIYLVRDLSDVIVEGAGAGQDTVRSFVSYSLSPNLEKLVLEGEGAIEGVGNDLDNEIRGGMGQNILSGGNGDDLLKGDLGKDLYLWVSGEGHDTIEDTDGQGAVSLEDRLLVGGVKKHGESVYTSLDERPEDRLTYAWGGGDLTITSSTGETITISQFTNGQFGISLIDAQNFWETPSVPPGARTEFLRIDHYVQVGTDPQGNPIMAPVHAPLFDDNGNNSGSADPAVSSEANVIHALGGNDYVVTFDGTDHLYGEGGDDTLIAGGNDDYLYGGDGWDTLQGGNGDDVLVGDYANEPTVGLDDTLDGIRPQLICVGA